MNSVWVIASNTFKEIIRDRILYGILVFTVLLFGMSLALGQLSFQEQQRISLDFGFMGIHLSAVIISIFLGSTLVSREIEKQTILTLLSRPLTRLQFLLGKFLGLAAINALVLTALSAILFLTALFVGYSPNGLFLVALFGILLETLILLAITMCFGVYTRPVLAVVYTIGFFLIGHWLNDLRFFAAKSESSTFRFLGDFLSKALPNFEFYNWRSLPIYNEPTDWKIITSATFSAIVWIALFFTIMNLIFRRRDFV